MKLVTRTFFGELFGNPINRNLFLIVISALIVAIFVVTGGAMLYAQW